MSRALIASRVAAGSLCPNGKGLECNADGVCMPAGDMFGSPSPAGGYGGYGDESDDMDDMAEAPSRRRLLHRLIML